tara:strand:+ start:681 stop:1034 length:354 start_codon:yes stop_codon:yes gene_type:complete
MDNFDLKKYLVEGTLNEANDKVLVDKVEPRWIIAEPDNINMKGLTAITPDTASTITYYKRKSSAEKELADLVISAEVKANKLKGTSNDLDDENAEFIKRVNNAEVIEVEMQVKITIK